MPGVLVPVADKLLKENEACSPGADGHMPRAGGESWAALMCGVT